MAPAIPAWRVRRRTKSRHYRIYSGRSNRTRRSAGLLKSPGRVKKRSPSCRMKVINKYFHTGETHDGLYNTGDFKQRRARAASEGDAIALRGVPAGGGWSRGARETL